MVKADRYEVERGGVQDGTIRREEQKSS